jgi:Phage Terminase
VVDVLETATGARRQPLLFEITTAGYDRHSICYEHQDYSIKVLEGTISDDSWSAFIAAADENDNWTDPGSGARPTRASGSRSKRTTSRARPRRRLRCRRPECLPAHAPERVDRAGRALDRSRRLGRLRRSGRPRGAARPRLLRRPRPLATTDITALAWVFPPEHEGGLWRVLSRYFVPEEHLRKRAERDRVPYDV